MVPNTIYQHSIVKFDCITQLGGSTTLKIHHTSQNSIFHRALGETSKILNLSSRPSNLHSYAWDTYFYHGYVAWSYLHRFYYWNCAVLDRAPWFNGFVHLLRDCPKRSSWRFQNTPNLWSLDDFESSYGNLKKIKVSKNNFDWQFSPKYKQILNYLKTSLFSNCHNLAQNYPIFTSWGCFGIVKSSSCWWEQRFWILMHPRLSNLRKTSAQILMTPTVLGKPPYVPATILEGFSSNQICCFLHWKLICTMNFNWKEWS